MHRATRDELVVSEPQRAEDALVESALRIVPDNIGGGSKTDERSGRIRRLPAIDAEERGGCDPIARLLHGFAHSGVDKTLARFEMAGRLVQPHAGARLFFYEQKRVFADDDSRDRHNRAWEIQ